MIQRTAALIEAHAVDSRGDHLDTPTDQTWQALLSGSITSPDALLNRLSLDPAQWREGAGIGHQLFAIRVPEPYAQRIEPGNPDDPLLRQVLPVTDEGQTLPGYLDDPLEEADAMVTTGLIRKYDSRALLMVTGQCAINCRYCFRRHFPYDEHRLTPDDRDAALRFLAASPDINEVILSGGDPLVASDRLLSYWASAIANIPHIRRLRIHTRLPIVIPQRITPDLLSLLGESRLQIVVVVHVNHPNELDESVRAAMARLRSAGVTLLNQSVILRGINDSADTLAELSERLFECHVLPYYLHAFDPVAGAHHFAVSDDRARGIVRELLGRLPGFLVPRLVREVPDKPGKTPIDLFA
ncbi:EF-P beta-lysylation protein EpmB [Marinobacter confluentis]|uniref:L-lysine 2,3-aminomutase n=1 Tax=Marinobacter confluentis TaxID=1697557 RepID=A0A4Z1C908_9GAMM|nr:EF-P beta-lysylation protein EpmB [Marinobacter confluentis]TGN40073.1 EF-P beta-lysylation protein EpmB [Marinobacter confluentis]